MNINVMRVDDLDVALEGWRNSRSADAAKNWREVFTIDVPVNELPSAVLRFDGFTILEREVFATLRSHVMWARTSHVDDPLRFKIPDGLQSSSNAANLRKMCDAKTQGLSQDEWRQWLPVTSTTAWTARVSFRDLVKLTRYFTYLIDRVDDVMKDRMAAVGDVLSDVITHAFTEDDGLTETVMAAFGCPRFLHEDWVDASLTIEVKDVDAFHHVAMSVPLWLRAQIVRHRPLTFVDDFFQLLTHPDVLDHTIMTPVNMNIVAATDYWRTVLSKRTCWLAQDELRGRKDPWQRMIDEFGYDDRMLPCAGGSCPYHGDAILRVEGKDPGVPCPRFCDLNGIDKAPHRDAMLRAAQSRHPSWVARIERSGSDFG